MRKALCTLLAALSLGLGSCFFDYNIINEEFRPYKIVTYIADGSLDGKYSRKRVETHQLVWDGGVIRNMTIGLEETELEKALTRQEIDDIKGKNSKEREIFVLQD